MKEITFNVWVFILRFILHPLFGFCSYNFEVYTYEVLYLLMVVISLGIGELGYDRVCD